MRKMEKAWSALTNQIQEEISLKKAIDFPLVGKFFAQNDQIVFVPHLDFINSGRFKFKQNEANISPLSRKVPKVTVNKLSLAQSQLGDAELDAYILKDVIYQFVKQNREGREVILDLKIGFIHAYPNGELQFEQLVDSAANQSS